MIPIPDAVAQDIISWWEEDTQHRPDGDKQYLVPAGRFYGASQRYVRSGGPCQAGHFCKGN